MENVSNYGEGKFGFETVFDNGLVSNHWFVTKSQRDSSFKEAKRKMINKKSVTKVSR